MKQTTIQRIMIQFDEDIFTMIGKNVDDAIMLDGHLNRKM